MDAAIMGVGHRNRAWRLEDHELASDRAERDPRPASLPRGSGPAGDPAQPPRGADNAAGCRSVTSAGRSPAKGVPAVFLWGAPGPQKDSLLRAELMEAAEYYATGADEAATGHSRHAA